MKITSMLMMALASLFAYKARPVAIPQMSVDQVVAQVESHRLIATCGTGTHGGSNYQTNQIV